MLEIVQAELSEYEGLVPFFIEQGLEFSEEDPVPTDLVKIWKAIENSERLGAIVLAKRDGKYIIDGLAVDPNKRGKKIGERLYIEAEREVKSRGGNEIFLVARIPEFWEKMMFLVVEKDIAPNFFECLTCSQFEKTCFPKVMRKGLESRKI